MSQEELACKIEDLQVQAEQTNSLQNALYAALYCQDTFAAANYEWAYILLGEMILDTAKKLEKLTNSVFEDLRAGQQK